VQFGEVFAQACRGGGVEARRSFRAVRVAQPVVETQQQDVDAFVAAQGAVHIQELLEDLVEGREVQAVCRLRQAQPEIECVGNRLGGEGGGNGKVQGLGCAHGGIPQT
jgi:hypothetical protein